MLGRKSTSGRGMRGRGVCQLTKAARAGMASLRERRGNRDERHRVPRGLAGARSCWRRTQGWCGGGPAQAWGGSAPVQASVFALGKLGGQWLPVRTGCWGSGGSRTAAGRRGSGGADQAGRG